MALVWDCTEFKMQKFVFEKYEQRTPVPIKREPVYREKDINIYSDNIESS